MSLEGWVFALLLALFVLAWVLMPLFSREKAQAEGDPLPEKQRERLLVYYERILRNIRDLDEDHALEKIAEDEYLRERAEWAERGVQVLQALDALPQRETVAAAPSANSAAAADDDAIDEMIEAAVRRYRQGRKP